MVSSETALHSTGSQAFYTGVHQISKTPTSVRFNRDRRVNVVQFNRRITVAPTPPGIIAAFA